MELEHLGQLKPGDRATVAGLISACAGDDRPDCPILDDLAVLMLAISAGGRRATR